MSSLKQRMEVKTVETFLTPGDLIDDRRFQAWLDKKAKDPKAQYNYNDPKDCLIAQYFKDHGFGDVSVYYGGIHTGPLASEHYNLPEHWDEIARQGHDRNHMNASLYHPVMSGSTFAQTALFLHYKGAAEMMAAS